MGTNMGQQGTLRSAGARQNLVTRRGRRALAAAVLAGAGACLMGERASAADKTWSPATDGEFTSPSHWIGGVPGAGDRAVFNVAGSYKVGFTNLGNVSTSQLLVDRGSVKFFNAAPNFPSYSLTSLTNSIVVGQTVGGTAQLTVTIQPGFGNLGLQGVDAVIGDQAGSLGVLNVGDGLSGALLYLTGPLTIGKSGSGALNLIDSSVYSGDTIIGAQTGSTGSMLLDASAWNLSGSLTIG